MHSGYHWLDFDDRVGCGRRVATSRLAAGPV